MIFGNRLQLAGNSLRVFMVLLSMLELLKAANDSDFKSGFKNRMAPITDKAVQNWASRWNDWGPHDAPDANWSQVDRKHKTRNPLLWQVWLPDRNRWAEPIFHTEGADRITVQTTLTKMWLGNKRDNVWNVFGGIHYHDVGLTNTIDNAFHTKNVTIPGTFYQQWRQHPQDTKLPVLCPDMLKQYLCGRLINKKQPGRGGFFYDHWEGYTWDKDTVKMMHNQWLQIIRRTYKPQAALMCPTCGHPPSNFGREKWQGVYCCYWCKNYRDNVTSFKNKRYYKTGNGNVIKNAPRQHNPACASAKKAATKKVVAKKTPTCKAKGCNRPPSGRKDEAGHCCYWCKNYLGYKAQLSSKGGYYTGRGVWMTTAPIQHAPHCRGNP